jgi:hypothetical protein
MWINFKSSRPFVVKIHAGGINAISGERQPEDFSTTLRRKSRLEEGKSIQDYIATGSQKWLDGIATLDGKVMQFVAAPIGSGYSVEAQLTGRDSVAGLQFEVMPTNRKLMKINIKTLTGKSIILRLSPVTLFTWSSLWLKSRREFHLISNAWSLGGNDLKMVCLQSYY